MKKKTFQLKINEPCHESWNEMTNSEKGRFCQSCEKEVIDFTHLSDRAIAQTFKKAKGTVCGRFNNLQLNRPIAYEPTIYQNTRLKAMGLMFSGLLMSSQLAGQTNPTSEVKTKQTENSPAESEKSEIVPDLITVKGQMQSKEVQEGISQQGSITNFENSIFIFEENNENGMFEFKIDRSKIEDIEKGISLLFEINSYRKTLLLSANQLKNQTVIDLGVIILDNEEVIIVNPIIDKCIKGAVTTINPIDLSDLTPKTERFIKGTLQNKNGERVSGAKVILTNRKYGLSSFLTKSEEVITDTNGYFELAVPIKKTNRLRNPLEIEIQYDGFSVFKDEFSKEDLQEDISKVFELTSIVEEHSIILGGAAVMDYLDDEDDLNTTSTIPHSSIIRTKIIKKIYPNPFTNELVVDLENEAAGSYHLILVNELGQEVYRKSIETIEGNQQIKLELQNFVAGAYFLSLLDREEVLQTEMVIKE